MPAPSCSSLPAAGPYSTYEGSPVSKGVLQPDMWGVKPTDRWDWAGLRRDIAAVRSEGCGGGGVVVVVGDWSCADVTASPATSLAGCLAQHLAPPPAFVSPTPCPRLQNGVRNSLLVAPMPTASTSQILGNNECFEPYTSNIYVRRVLSGAWVGWFGVGCGQEVQCLEGVVAWMPPGASCRR